MSVKRFLRAAMLALAATLTIPLQAGAADATADGQAVAIFAGGCFWCVESDFDKLAGVKETVSGYTGGTLDKPSYKQVTAGGTGHREAVRIVYDPAQVSYQTLLEVFWHSVDPTDAGGQFCDRGHSYTTAIYATDEAQLRQAQASKAAVEASGVLKDPIATEIVAAGPFFPAEEYHQDFYTKSPVRYRVYRFSCGRDARVEELWGADAHKGIKHEGS